MNLILASQLALAALSRMFQVCPPHFRLLALSGSPPSGCHFLGLCQLPLQPTAQPTWASRTRPSAMPGLHLAGRALPALLPSPAF